MSLEKSSERPPIDCKERLALTATAACFPEDLRRRWDVAYQTGFQAGFRAALQKLLPEVFGPSVLEFVRIMARVKGREENMPTPEEAGKIREILALKDSLHITDDQFCEKGVEYVALARRALAAYDEQS